MDSSGNIYIADSGNDRICVLSTDTTTPTVETIAIASEPLKQATYSAKEVIRVMVTFSEAVVVAGTPQLTIEVGERIERQSMKAAWGLSCCCLPGEPKATATPTG